MENEDVDNQKVENTNNKYCFLFYFPFPQMACEFRDHVRTQAAAEI